MTNTSTAAQQNGVPAAGRYRLAPARSSVTFRTRHLFGLGVVSGTMEVVAGEITVDPAAGQATVTAVVSAASFHTGSRLRDRDVHSAKFLDTGQYPHITFRAGTLRRDSDGWTLAGELTVREVSKPVTLTIESAEETGPGFRAHATARIDRYVFGVTAAKGMAARYLDINLTAAAEPLEPASDR
jgi:polyisoprenoid-binding protein YceI